ncbi:MAG TPA: hypothetical protein VI893_10560 [Thermoplasmata archaeon]|nr:hypothetical protein [Thermoplasmata archaeon]
MVSALAVAGGVIGFAFAGFTGWRYLKKGRLNNLCWTVGLVLWGVVSFLEAFAEAPFGWSDASYRVYYANQAALVAILAAGTVYLLKEEKAGHAFLLYTIVLSVAFAALASMSPTSPEGLCNADASGICQGGSIGGAGWDASAGYPAVRVSTFLLTIPGSIVLIGGALLSWWRTKTVYNLLIGVGAMAIALAGVFARLDLPQYLPLANIISISLMFVGFLYATEEMKVKSDQAVATGKPAV